ncbi:jg10442 [Pararge aegeria aegeria]|uniref:Jg10442 protein n=2 Tax=Pararge aegeria TaxID=116150 RepID=A0A8S4RD15_9NEOP|nr:jg10442 [Pararge aegeria aegeria]
MYEEGGEYRCVGARAPDLKRLRELKRVTLRVTGGATATAISADYTPSGWRLECGACGRNLRVMWLRDGQSMPAILTPDLAQHCWKAILLVPEPDEVWCIVVSSSGGAVAVFPRRTVEASPSPARHAVRALQAGAGHVRAVRMTVLIGLLAGFV